MNEKYSTDKHTKHWLAVPIGGGSIPGLFREGLVAQNKELNVMMMLMH